MDYRKNSFSFIGHQSRHNMQITASSECFPCRKKISNENKKSARDAQKIGSVAFACENIFIAL
jgi:hypothetical protein